MKREKVMTLKKPIIEDKAKRYTFITWYDKDDSYRLTQCEAKTLDDAEHQFADLINLPYIKSAGRKEWHLDIGKDVWKPLRVNRYKDIWTVDFIIRNNFIMSYVKISEILNVSDNKLFFFTFALGCVEGGPFIIQCEAHSLYEAMANFIKRIPYQKYLSKGFRIKLKTDISNGYTIEELQGMNNAFRIGWNGCDCTLFIIKDNL